MFVLGDDWSAARMLEEPKDDPGDLRTNHSPRGEDNHRVAFGAERPPGRAAPGCVVWL